MPKSRNKYSRAQLRARYRKPRRRGSSNWFYGALGVIVIAGVLGIVFVRSDNQASAVAPQPPSADNPAGDHWHSVIGVNICGEWLPDPPLFENQADNPGVQAGIHTHGDGFIHIHPFTPSEGGDHATLGRFMNYGGWDVSSDSISAWTGPSDATAKKTWSNGDKCPGANGKAGQPGHLVWAVDCKSKSGNPSDYKLEDQQVIAIGFLTKDQKLDAPPHADTAPQNDGVNSPAFNVAGCRPSAQNNPGLPDTVATTTTPTASSAPASSTP